MQAEIEQSENLKAIEAFKDVLHQILDELSENNKDKADKFKLLKEKLDKVGIKNVDVENYTIH